MPTQATTSSLLEYFADLPDPRIDRCKDHALIDIITIAILATICGAEHFTEMETFGEAKHDWLKTFLKLENGIPSHDTFARVFARIKPAAFQERFARWVQAVRTATDDEVIGIDGKTARRSHNKGAGLGPLHLVSAWASRNRLVLGQVKVDEKSNDHAARRWSLQCGRAGAALPETRSQLERAAPAQCAAVRTAAAAAATGTEEAPRTSPGEGSTLTEVKRSAYQSADGLGAGQRRLVRRSNARPRTGHWHGLVEARRIETTANPLGAGQRPIRRTGNESLFHYRPGSSGGRRDRGFCPPLDDRSDV